MKQNNSGFSLVEVVVAMAILGTFAIISCTSLVLGLRMNEKSDSMLQAQLAVSTAVETLMAEGIREDSTLYTMSQTEENTFLLSFTDEDFEDLEDLVTVEVIKQINTPPEGESKPLPYYMVTVTGLNEGISISTYIREVPTE